METYNQPHTHTDPPTIYFEVPNDGRQSGGHPLPGRSQHHRVIKFWIFEVISTILSIGLIVATFSILAHFDGQVVPDWPFGISLNTLIALLSTICRALVLVVVAEVIGQKKWFWFSSAPRPISHFQRFDSGSRGLLGSLRLVFTAPGSPTALFGSLIIILSLAMGPFSQQAIKSIECPQYVSGVNASVPVAHFASLTFFRIGAGEWRVSYDTQGAMINGLLNPTGNDSAVSATCQTGNCTFTPDSTNITYSSIGLCSSCIDVTSTISYNISQIEDYDMNYTLPSDAWIDSQRASMWGKFLDVRPDYNLSWASTLFSDDFATTAPQSLINVTILEATNVTANWDDTSPQAVVAAACTLYPCLKNYYGQVSDGVFTEEVVSTVPATDYVPISVYAGDTYNYTALKTPCVIEGKEYNSSNNFAGVPSNYTFVNVTGQDGVYTAPDVCLYKMYWIYANAMAYFMETTLFTSGDSGCIWEDDAGPEFIFCTDALWLEPLYNSGNATFDTISTAIEQFSTAVTNKFRTAGTSNDDSSLHETVLGAVSQTTVCISFEWQWLLLNVIVILISTILLISILVQHYRYPEQPIWKSSLLPFLFYGLESSSGEPKPVADLDILDNQASEVVARLCTGFDGAVMKVESPEKGAEENAIEVDSLLGD